MKHTVVLPLTLLLGGLVATISGRELAGAPPESDSFLGPIIGVQIAHGTVTREVIVGPGGMRIEWPGGREDLSPGKYPLRLGEEGAYLGKLDFGRSIPFRFRAENGSTQVGEGFYEGWLEVPLPKGQADWRLINRLPLERYLLGVLPGEMPASRFPMQALGAQAVAARTYALFQILARDPSSRIHVYADDRSQVYLGGGVPHPRVLEAVEKTHGQVLLAGDKVFECFFHSTCGGSTRSVEDWFGGDPIASLASVLCDQCQESKFYRWEQRLEESDLRTALAPICRRHRIELGDVLAIEPVDPGPGGHCSYFRIRHELGTFEVDADRFRSAARKAGIELRSTAFVAERLGTSFRFVGRGWGHGVGMCQFGARGYAEERWDYRRILAHYYPRSTLSRLWE